MDGCHPPLSREDGEVSPANREWLTEREIKSVINDEVKQTLEKLVDGAQASINTATILHGSPELGMKGVLPDIQERLAHLEEGQQHDRDLNEQRHTENTKRLGVLEENQHRIKRCIVWATGRVSVIRSEWKMVAAFLSAAGITASAPAALAWAKRVALHLLGKHTN